MRPTLSLKATLAILFGLLALISTAQGGLSVRELAAIREAATALATNWLPSLETISAVEVAASEVRIKQYRLILLSDTAEHRAINESNLAATHAKLREARTAYEPLISSAEERRLYEAFATSWTAFEGKDGDVRRLMEAGRAPEALALLSDPAVVALYDDCLLYTSPSPRD